MAANFIGRVDHLESIELDQELSEYFTTKIKDIFSNVPYGIWSKCLPEIQTLAEFTIKYFTFFKRGATIGQNMLGLKIKEISKWRTFLCLVLEVFPTYVSLRLQSDFKSSKVFEQLSLIWAVFKVLNTCIFFQEGKYPTIARRLCKLKLQRTETYNGRNISYEYVSRELLWHSLMDLLSFIIPLINIYKIRNTLSKYLPISHVEFDPFKCGYCNSEMILASKANCDHNFCYYCISSNLKADKNYLCPICKTVLKLEQVKPIIIEEPLQI